MINFDDFLYVNA